MFFYLIAFAFSKFICNKQPSKQLQYQVNNKLDPFCRTNIKQFTILYLGPKIWNSFPDVTSSNSFSSFKKRVYDFLLN